MKSTIKILNGLEFLYPENVTISQIKRTLDLFPETEEYLIDAYSIGQLKSKLWLIENLPDNLNLIFICAGWYGTLANLMFQKVSQKFNKIRSFDIDPGCAEIADNINRPFVINGWQFKASTLDICTMEFPTTYKTFRRNGTSLTLTEMPDTIINTSCEHITNFEQWFWRIPSRTLCVLQSNDFVDCDQHVNCVSNLYKFADQTPLDKVIYEGELDCNKYKRFMRIGYK